jgi:hypothetical protein
MIDVDIGNVRWVTLFSEDEDQPSMCSVSIIACVDETWARMVVLMAPTRYKWSSIRTCGEICVIEPGEPLQSWIDRVHTLLEGRPIVGLNGSTITKDTYERVGMFSVECEL